MLSPGRERVPEGHPRRRGRRRLTVARAVVAGALLIVLAVAGGAALDWLSSVALPLGGAQTPRAPQTPMAGAEGQLDPRSRERERDTEPPLPHAGVWDLGAHDMNGDQRLDLVIATGGPGSLAGSVSLLLDPGRPADLTDWERVTLPTRGDYGRLAVGDIDGDGVEDVAALTFGTHVLRWWLLAADHSVRDERSLSFAEAALPGRTCPGPGAEGPPLTLSSLALADLDVDHQLELAVVGYAHAGEGGTFLFSYQLESGCFELRPALAQRTGGSLRVRFFDVDDDGELDVVSSHYALARPRPTALKGCAECLEWGEWRRTSGGPPEPLVARFADQALLAAEPTPELNVVDFDALATPAGARFALAGSAHLCPAEDCWGAGRGGFVSVVDASGVELATSDAWKQRVEQAPPVARALLLPRAVSFVGASDAPSLVAAHWWATRRKDSPCGRVTPCAGPLTVHAAGAGEPRALEPWASAQALGFLAGAGAQTELTLSCQPAARSLLPLPETGAIAIVGVELNGRALPRAAYSWVAGSRVVALAREPAREPGRVCIRYARARGRPVLAVADSSSGPLLVDL